MCFIIEQKINDKRHIVYQKGCIDVPLKDTGSDGVETSLYSGRVSSE